MGDQTALRVDMKKLDVGSILSGFSHLDLCVLWKKGIGI